MARCTRYNISIKNRPNTDRIQHVEDGVIKFVSDMRKIGGFLRVSIFFYKGLLCMNGTVRSEKSIDLHRFPFLRRASTNKIKSTHTTEILLNGALPYL